MNDNANYVYISKVNVGGTSHYVKDAEARTAITGLESSKQNVIDADHKLSYTLVDGLATVAHSGSFNDLLNKPTIDTTMSDSSTNAVQNSTIKAYVDAQISGLGSVLNYKGTKASEAAIKAITTAAIGDVWINTADNSEWVCISTLDGTASAAAWEKLGPTIDLSGYALKSELGDLAYEDTAEGAYTPAGTIGVGSGTTNYTPAGTITAGEITVTPNETTVNSITAVGSIATHAADTFVAPTYTQGTYTEGTAASWSASVSNEELSFSWSTNTPGSHASDSFTAGSFTSGAFNGGTTPTKGDDTTVVTGIRSATSTAPTFAGTAVHLEFTGTEQTVTVAPAAGE